MTIEEIIVDRKITEILHFTTNEGLLGILHTKYLQSRKKLPEVKQLKYIFKPNALLRKDPDWLDYVNLSISRINHHFFKIAATRWHKDRDIWWCVLSFNPVILTHEGVSFATTNNMYSGVTRETGVEGLEALFAKQITRWEKNVIIRKSTLPANYTTCSQAEVLYPDEISTALLNKVYVKDDNAHDDICGQLAGVRHPDIKIETNAKIFEA